MVAEAGTFKLGGDPGLHNKPLGCGASEVYASGPAWKKKKKGNGSFNLVSEYGAKRACFKTYVHPGQKASKQSTNLFYKDIFITVALMRTQDIPRLPPATTDSMVAKMPASLSALVGIFFVIRFLRDCCCCSSVRDLIWCNPISDRHTPSM